MAKDKNNKVVVLTNGTAYIKLARNTRKYISNSLQGHKLFWGLTGCLPGQQHFRFCTAHALKGPQSLQCMQCWCWQHFGGHIDLRNMPKGERLLMLALLAMGMSSGVCRQVAVWWWHGRIDFYDTASNTYIQSDGTCHDRGIHSYSREEVLDLDLEFCVAAYNKILPQGQSVVRVRACEKSLHMCLATAMDVAAVGGCIVLSPSFAAVACHQPGSAHAPLPTVLRAMLPGCRYSVLHGMHVFKRGNN